MRLDEFVQGYAAGREEHCDLVLIDRIGQNPQGLIGCLRESCPPQRRSERSARGGGPCWRARDLRRDRRSRQAGDLPGPGISPRAGFLNPGSARRPAC